MYTSLDFRGGGLSHKQGSLIHQFGVWLSCDLKNRLLLLLLFQLIGFRLSGVVCARVFFFPPTFN
jgi:hypothetical protein